MGAAILVQSLAVETRFCAAIAESPFADFRQAAYERVSEHTGTGLWFGKTLGGLAVESGLLYARMRYHVDLGQASPLNAARISSVPLLLIHGEQDRNIWPVNSQMIHQAAASHTELWIVPKAWHTGAWATDPPQFERRVLGWCAGHRSATQTAGLGQ